MNKKTQLIILIPIVLLYIILGLKIFENKDILFPPSNKTNPSKRLSRLIDYINTNYVDEINTDSLVESTIEKIIENLDPHTVYIPKRISQQIYEEMQGSFVGIGVSFYMERDTVIVARLLDGGPSKKVGILAGDRILIANKDTLYNKNLESQSITQKLKGKANTEVYLTIYRKSKDSILNFTLKRAEVPIKSIESDYMIKEDVGYIKLNRFSKTSYDELKKALTKLKNKGADKIIFDLRDNPGGFLDVAEKIADEFLVKGKIIIQVKEKRGKMTKTYSTDTGDFTKTPLVILVNEESASASEVIAGAIQDNDRGYIIGRRTFGKGLVQQQMPLGGGDAIRLTTARYYTPTGRSIQRDYKDTKDKYFQDIQSRYDSGEMISEDSIPVIDSLKYITPKGRTVYGGGGIIPDVYIPHKIIAKEQWQSTIIQSPLMNYFVFQLVDEDRENYLFDDESDFIESPLKNKKLILNKFHKFCENNSIPIQITDETFFYNHVKATLGLQLFGENIYYKFLNKSDPFVLKALEQIHIPI